MRSDGTMLNVKKIAQCLLPAFIHVSVHKQISIPASVVRLYFENADFLLCDSLDQCCPVLETAVLTVLPRHASGGSGGRVHTRTHFSVACNQVDQSINPLSFVAFP